MHKKCAQAQKKMVQFLRDSIRDIRAKAAADDMSDAGGGAAALDVDAAAQDVRSDTEGDGAGVGVGGARRSQRILTRNENGCSVHTSGATLCEIRRAEGVVYVPAALPVQGAFCSAECVGETGKCCNQVPHIETDDNVEVSQAVSECGNYLTAKRDIAAGEIFTVFGGGLLKQLEYPEAFKTYSDMHTVQQQTEKGERKFEYSAQTGNYGMPDSQAWVIPPEDMPLLQQNIQRFSQQNTHLHILAKHSETWQQGLGQFAQHTCCKKHVNAYFFPICTMGTAPRVKGNKRLQEAEIMDVQALGIRAQRDIKKGAEILVHYVGSGKTGDYVFDCRCCQCVGLCKRV